MAQHGSDLAAIVMEPIRSEQPAPGFLDGVKKMALESCAVLIVDEVSSGFRMNSGGAHLKLGLTPDIAVFSKALGNGFPIAAVIGNDVMDAAQSTFISSTNWTERVGSVAALATITKHRSRNVGSHLMDIGSRVQEGWLKLAENCDLHIHVGGIAPLSHFAFEGSGALEKKAFFVQSMLKEGFLASTSFYAMYAHTLEHVESYLAAAKGVFERLAELAKSNSLSEYLEGKPSVAGFKRLT